MTCHQNPGPAHKLQDLFLSIKLKYQCFMTNFMTSLVHPSVDMASEVETSETNTLSWLTSHEAILNNINQESLKSYIIGKILPSLFSYYLMSIPK